jgi:hypothetical protein
MSALEALVLAGKGLNAFSVLFSLLFALQILYIKSSSLDNNELRYTFKK